MSRISFEILPGYVHAFRVYHNGGSYKTPSDVTAPDPVEVQTARSTLMLIDSGGNPFTSEQRVDLLRSNSSSTGVRMYTGRDDSPTGVAEFEILPDYEHRFKVYHNGGVYKTKAVVYGDTVVVQTAVSSFTLTDSDKILRVNYHGILPQTFGEGKEIIIEGRYDPNGTFEASAILTKCPSKYTAPEQK